MPNTPEPDKKPAPAPAPAAVAPAPKPVEAKPAPVAAVAPAPKPVEAKPVPASTPVPAPVPVVAKIVEEVVEKVAGVEHPPVNPAELVLGLVGEVVDHVESPTNPAELTFNVVPSHVAESLISILPGSEQIPTDTTEDQISAVAKKLADAAFDASSGDPATFAKLGQLAGQAFKDRAIDLIDNTEGEQ